MHGSPPSPTEISNALRATIRWSLADQFLGREGIERWGVLAAKLAVGPQSEELAPDLDLVFEFSRRQQHWLWLGIAILAGQQRRPASKGGTKLGKKGLQRLARCPGSKQVTAGKAVAHVDRSLQSGIAPSEIDFSRIQGLKAWEGDALHFALALLAGTSRPAPSYQSVSITRPGSGALPKLWFGIPMPSARTHGPDLPLEDLYEEPALIRIPDSNESGAGEVAPIPGSPIYEQWLAESCHTVHLAGALLPGTERTFSRLEVLTIARTLAAVWLDSETTEAIRLCALAYALSLLTGRSRKSAVAAMARQARSACDPKGDWLSAEAFRVRIPHRQAFGKPTPRAQASLLPTSSDFWLPLPHLIQSALAGLENFSPLISGLTEPGWNAHFELLKRRLADVAPRFSEARLQHVMPVAVWTRSGDTVRTQMISGQLLDHPSAALHYYAYSVQELVETYLTGIRNWLPDDWAVESPDLGNAGTALIGAPSAAIRDDALRVAVATLVAEDLTRSRSRSLDELIDSYNRVVGVTVAMFAAATAHRLTYHLGHLRRGDFILDLPNDQDTEQSESASTGCALTIFADKLTDNGLVYRVAAVPPVLVEQILALLAAIRKMRRAFSSSLYGRSAAEHLKCIEEGRASLFQLIDRRHRKGEAVAYRPRRFRRADMRLLWPELQIPVEHLRHRFTTIARRHGLAPDDIRRQMGHSIDAIPFGPTDPDSAIEFVARVSSPLDVALRDDGWRPVRLDARDASRNEMPPLSCAEVLRLEHGLLSHSQRRTARLKRLIGKQRDQSRSDVIGMIDQLTSSAEGADAEPEPRVERSLSSGNRVAEQLAQCCSEPVMQPEISKILRTWARSQKNGGRWSAPLPRMSFRKCVEVPHITPASTRAYATANSLLSFAESQDITAVKAGSSASQEMLVLAVIELSVRSGLTSPDRLLGCIRALGAVRQYGEREDHVVVPLASNRRAGDAPASQGLADSDEYNAAEGLLLTGLPALLGLAWRSRGIDSSGVTLQDLSDACRSQVPGLILGRIDPKASALEVVLRIAALARRLTQPGLRHAWEEGRTNSQSLNIARAYELRSTDWFEPPSRVLPEEVNPSGERRDFNPKALSSDAKFLRWMRGYLHERIKKKGGAMSYSRIAAQIEGKLTGAHGCSGTASVFVNVVVGWLKRGESTNQLRLRTIYTYLVAILEPMLKQIGTDNLTRLDADSLEELVTRVVLSARENNRQRMLRVIQEVVSEVAAQGGAQLEEGALTDLLPMLMTSAAPYLITAKEQTNARVQLQHWKSGIVDGFSAEASGGLNIRDCEGAVRLLTCSRHGLRAGEALSRRRQDFVDTTDGLTLLVRPRRGNPLKTLSSSRAIDLDGLSHEESQEFRRWLGADEDRKDRTRPATALHSADIVREVGSEEAIRVTRTALSLVAGGNGSRYHAGRHAIACAAIVRIMPRYLNTETYRALGMPTFLESLSALPKNIQLHAVARFLGQATALTTLTHYVHLIGYFGGSDGGWPLPTTRGMSNLAIIRHGDLRTRLSRRNISARKLTGVSLIELLEVGSAQVPRRNGAIDFVPRRSLPISLKAGGSLGSYQLLGATLHGIVSGVATPSLVAKYGLSAESLNRVVQEALVLQEQYRYRLLRSGDGGSVEPTGRVPRLSSVSGILKRCDAQSAASSSDWGMYVRALERQTRLDGRILIGATQNPDCVAHMMSKMLSCSVNVRELPDRRLQLDHGEKVAAGAARGRATAAIAYCCFTVLLLPRLREPNSQQVHVRSRV